MPHPATTANPDESDDLADKVATLTSMFGIRRTAQILGSTRTVIERAGNRQHVRAGSRLQLVTALAALPETTPTERITTR
jgi:hypothetical protein